MTVLLDSLTGVADIASLYKAYNLPTQYGRTAVLDAGMPHQGGHSDAHVNQYFEVCEGGPRIEWTDTELTQRQHISQQPKILSQVGFRCIDFAFNSIKECASNCSPSSLTASMFPSFMMRTAFLTASWGEDS